MSHVPESAEDVVGWVIVSTKFNDAYVLCDRCGEKFLGGESYSVRPLKRKPGASPLKCCCCETWFDGARPP